jgi:hypothetical protein
MNVETLPPDTLDTPSTLPATLVDMATDDTPAAYSPFHESDDGQPVEGREIETDDPTPVDIMDAPIATEGAYDPLTIPSAIIDRIVRSWAKSAYRWQTLDPHRTLPPSREEADDAAAALYLWSVERGEEWYTSRGLRPGNHRGYQALIRACANRMHWRLPGAERHAAGKPKTAANRDTPYHPWQHGSPPVNPAIVAAMGEALDPITSEDGRRTVAYALNGYGIDERPELDPLTGEHETTFIPASRGGYRETPRMKWIPSGRTWVEEGEEMVELRAAMVADWSNPVEWPASHVVNTVDTTAAPAGVERIHAAAEVQPGRWFEHLLYRRLRG